MAAAVAGERVVAVAGDGVLDRGAAGDREPVDAVDRARHAGVEIEGEVAGHRRGVDPVDAAGVGEPGAAALPGSARMARNSSV